MHYIKKNTRYLYDCESTRKMENDAVMRRVKGCKCKIFGIKVLGDSGTYLRGEDEEVVA